MRAALGMCPQPPPEDRPGPGGPAAGGSGPADAGHGSEQRENGMAPPGGLLEEIVVAVDGGFPNSSPAFSPLSGEEPEAERYGERRRRSKVPPPLATPALSGSEPSGKVPDVQGEIEQHWLQVETVLLREEKQHIFSPDLAPETPPPQPARPDTQVPVPERGLLRPCLPQCVFAPTASLQSLLRLPAAFVYLFTAD